MTTIVGNKLNSANKKILDRMNKMDFDFIKKEAISQIESGAEYIEVNALSLLHNETPFLRKIIPMLEKLGAKLMIISENVEALKEALLISKNPMIIGAVEYDIEKIDFLIDTVKDKNAKIIALIRDKSNSHHSTPEKSLLIAQKYIDYLLDLGMKRQDILLDPLVSLWRKILTTEKSSWTSWNYSNWIFLRSKPWPTFHSFLKACPSARCSPPISLPWPSPKDLITSLPMSWMRIFTNQSLPLCQLWAKTKTCRLI